jgi:hypothetical protein
VASAGGEEGDQLVVLGTRTIPLKPALEDVNSSLGLEPAFDHLNESTSC